MKKRLGIIAGILGIVLAVIGIVLKQKANTAVSVIIIWNNYQLVELEVVKLKCKWRVM